MNTFVSQNQNSRSTVLKTSSCCQLTLSSKRPKHVLISIINFMVSQQASALISIKIKLILFLNVAYFSIDLLITKLFINLEQTCAKSNLVCNRFNSEKL
ncbi:hypothetical protein BpHYR1_024209 [Brachionus plicatilis]|uniref:Uncharacterized protein n=1 Tax=Brachionus plicatilis TaxID=10195 RepID=A0A3M7SHA2_BRAPC|nr:hypothetical protein BpHYR1_024209 [Brachionus plicatilis]